MFLPQDSFIQPCENVDTFYTKTSKNFESLKLQNAKLSFSTSKNKSSNISFVTTLYSPEKEERFLKINEKDDVLPCGAILQMISIKEIGEINDNIDYTVVYDGLTKNQIKLLEKYRINTIKGNIPDVNIYDNKFEAYTMLKVDVVSLVQYKKIIYIDLDMFPRSSLKDHVRINIKEDALAWYQLTTPFSSNFFVLKPSTKMYKFLRSMADIHPFTIERGWYNKGLVNWPFTKGCNASYLQNGLVSSPKNRRKCKLSDKWVKRCQMYKLTNWNFMHAGSDQGAFWYAYNISKMSSVFTFEGSKEYETYDGEKFKIGRQYWHHMSGRCKPWLISKSTLNNKRCLEAAKYFWGTLWKSFRIKYDLYKFCPTMEKKYKFYLEWLDK
tara:strand:- start:1179 stop:2324 length:1146 start_codon:yes stop_codon:yes gene_type:complete